MIVKTIEDFDDLPKGSCVYVDSEDDEFYFGRWSFNCCTATVVVCKSICEIIEE